MKLVLVRHGVAEGADGFCVGHRDLGLSARGADDIRRLAAAWQGVTARNTAAIGVPSRIVASDLRRAADSASVLAVPWKATVEVDPRLREMDFGEWDGHTWHALQARDGERLQAWMEDWVDTRAPGGESFADVAIRVAEWIDECRAREDDQAVVLAVAHAGAIRAVLCHLLRWPLDHAFQVRIDHARVTALSVGARGVELQFLNADRVPEAY